MRSTPKKTCRQIIKSGNHYLGALKGNHGKFFKALKQNFESDAQISSVDVNHGRVEARTVSLWRDIDALPQADQWAGLKTIIKVTSYRYPLKGHAVLIKRPAVRYYISSLNETVEALARRIRDYWHVENKVHHVRDVTQGEDASRIRVLPLPNIFASARNLALNLYRQHGFTNMAQTQRMAGYGLELLKTLFRMK